MWTFRSLLFGVKTRIGTVRCLPAHQAIAAVPRQLCRMDHRLLQVLMQRNKYRQRSMHVGLISQRRLRQHMCVRVVVWLSHKTVCPIQIKGVHGLHDVLSSEGKGRVCGNENVLLARDA